MFFLLRVAFWLTVVLVLLPSGGGRQDAQAKVNAAEAVVAAGAAMSDMSGFCERQPEACSVGAQAATVISQRAQAGARLVYDFINDRAAQPGQTGSTDPVKHDGVKHASMQKPPAASAAQGTLKASDLEPGWHGPPARGENVPLPRKAPHRKA